MFAKPAKNWLIPSWLLALLLSLPLLALIISSLQPADETFQHLLDTVLWDYVGNSLKLVSLTIVFALLFALPAAWWVANCEFPGRRYFSWMLLLPLAMPGYVVAYIYTDFLDYAGPVQRALRGVFGWTSPQDYSFWEVRSISGAALVLALGLFPYIYLIVRNTFAQQEAQLVNAARLLGASPWQSFWRVALPLARPAIVIGVSLVAMETLADFAVAHYFAVSTLTTAVYDTWLGLNSLEAAARLSVFMLLGIMALVILERVSRRGQVQLAGKNAGSVLRLKMSIKGRVLAWLFCASLFVAGFLFPFVTLLDFAFSYFSEAWSEELFEYSWNSLTLSGSVALICLLMALLFTYNQRLHSSVWQQVPVKLSSSGYAIPGTVLAIGVLIALTALDHGVNRWAQSFSLERPGLIFSGTVFAIGFAFIIRFMAIANGAIEAGFSRLPESLDLSSRLLGQNAWQTFYRVHLPLLKMPMLTAALLVLIECMKELPASLILRPFNYDTLATYVYQYVSDEQLELASLGAIFIVLMGLLPVMVMARNRS
ncbi:MAG: iron ABC transporter permease [Candidatus Pelagadaptatus aseana]|uniref:ABC transporter permease n=1 Tax=Candidatus Pelagadaptatus aseana TaxID=3120508 RepID=UPI0039B307B5